MFSLFCLFCFSLLIPIKDWGKDHFTLVIVLQLSVQIVSGKERGGGGGDTGRVVRRLYSL